MNGTSHTILNNGVKMPWLGLGVYKAAEKGNEVQRAIVEAVEQGYRSIDTASFYNNEVGVGEGARNSGIDRDDLFITTKVWNAQQGYESTLKAFNRSMKKLKMDYIDLYLVHWPVKNKYVETWQALEKLYEEGYVRSIGVSNFQKHHLEDIMQQNHIVPAVNQVEYHPLLQQTELLTYCQSKNIQMEAWSPLCQGKLMDNKVLQWIADKHDKSIAQIILRWDIQNQVVTIPKSVNPDRIRSNAEIFDFELDVEDMNQIASLNQNKRVGPDPDHFDF